MPEQQNPQADDSVQRAKQMLDQEKEATERSRAEYADRMKGKPTPTQEENDLAKLGAHLVEKEDDGSGPDPNVLQNRSLEAGRGQPYQTRDVRETRAASPRAANPPQPQTPGGPHVTEKR